MVRIDLGYDGSGFFGSQRQPELRTVQGELEAAATRVTNQSVQVTLAGRTDRGVHAVGQVGSAQLRWRWEWSRFARALQAVTPDDLVIYRVAEVDEGFHARYDAREREYRYRIWEAASPPILGRHGVWARRERLDLGAMRQAAETLIGRYDFAAFAGDGVGMPGAKVDTVRTVVRSEWHELAPILDRADRGGRLIEFRIAANGFLPHMVRNIVGALAEVGRGALPVDSIPALLEARDRRLAPEPAPAAGLTLWRIRYAQDDEAGVTVGADAADGTGVEGNEDVHTEGI